MAEHVGHAWDTSLHSAPNKPLRVAVIGAGVVGMTTAHFLQRAGCNVEVFESQTAPAMGTSRANGGQLSYSFTDALASPDLIWKLPSILAGRDPAFQIRPRASLPFLIWGLRFLWNCRRAPAQRNSDSLFALALQSSRLMQEFHDRHGDAHLFRKAGKIVLLPQAPSDAELTRIQRKRDLGCDLEVVERDELVHLDPALEHWRGTLAAGIHAPDDEVADPRRFCETLADDLSSRGVSVHFDCCVKEIETRGNRVRALISQHGRTTVDAIVVCTGMPGSNLLHTIGVRLPVYPIAGYSVSLPAIGTSPMTSITVLERKIVFSRLADQVRIAGFADINPGADAFAERTEHLLETARCVAPVAADYAAPANPWMGHRPSTPDSLPITGPTKTAGLYLNLGHGMLGWTLASASGMAIAEQVTGNTLLAEASTA